jgi:hypothetical protein
MSMTVIKNTGEQEVTLRWNGQDLYTIEPGKTAQVPEHLAKHYAGDWELKDTLLQEEEDRRVRGLHGGKRPLQVVRQVAEKPKPARTLPKLPGDGGEGEQPFAALEQTEEQ